MFDFFCALTHARNPHAHTRVLSAIYHQCVTAQISSRKQDIVKVPKMGRLSKSVLLLLPPHTLGQLFVLPYPLYAPTNTVCVLYLNAFVNIWYPSPPLALLYNI